MKTLTLHEAQKMMKENHGDLNLYNSDITALPNGLAVDGSLIHPVCGQDLRQKCGL